MSELSRISILLSNIPQTGDLLRFAATVESSGYERVWLAETIGIEAGAIGGAIAATTSLQVGTAIVPVYSRSPALLAMMASSWSHIGNGRQVNIGIGSGGQRIIERWHGVDFTKPATTTRDTIAIMRQALAGERTDVDGKMRRSNGFSLASGPTDNVKIFIGGMGPVMVDLAAEQADGLIVTWLSPRVVEGFRATFNEAITSHGRRHSDVELVARAYVAVTDTPELAREEVRKEMVEYIISPPYGRYFSSVGFDDEVQAVNAAFTARDRAGAVQAVSDRLLDDVLIAGTSGDEVADRLRAYVAAGADDVMIQPVPDYRGGNYQRTIEDVARALG
ncbi:LLM class flavin-dependent oxidoreductase [Gordonia polyisoprenivorans]|uniref:LLM class flavin-dependent oxidoreductase n=1 Tax=Gordonia polyisoprenivorans TaxID=84595 RepID=UPI001AD725DF|nr:LLM class flavin-dependent oxidoreductase [Gordonia polyisoprenivorans]QTI69941.1 LLM class flavin-dependent oxidoreductase [Gordonia polyisoprenivorans]